jgi:hypothetical protein
MPIKKRPQDTTPPPPSMDAQDVVDAIMALSGGSGDQDLKLPADYQPPLRRVAAPGVGPTYFMRKGLVDANGLIVTADGRRVPLAQSQGVALKEEYTSDEIKSIWLGLDYNTRKYYGKLMKAMNVYGTSKPSPNFDQNVDLNAFAKVLFTANVEQVTWDAAIPIIAERFRTSQPMGAGKPSYKPTNIEEVKRIIQNESRERLGRELSVVELDPLAAKVQRQEVRTVTQPTGQQPRTPYGLAESAVEKQFRPEADAFRFASLVDTILGTK